MKKITILFIALMATTLVFAQGGRQMKSQNTKSSFNEKIKAVLKESQQEFYEVLSVEEMAKITELKTKLDVIWSQVAENTDKEKTKEQIMALNSKANEIADAHPKEAKAYTKKINSLTQEMQSQRSAKGQNKSGDKGNGKGNKKGGSKPMLKHMSDPGFILLWDENRKPMHKGQGKGGKRTSFINNMPELMSELQQYALANILPDLSQKRSAFDTELSSDEKEEIALARGKIETRQQMYKAWKESDDFEAGARRDDPKFDNMREDMQNSMQQIRQIAINHSNQLEEIRNSLKPNSDKWRKEAMAIMENYDIDGPDAAKIFEREYKRNNTSIAFLLLDPENMEKSKMFGLHKR